MLTETDTAGQKRVQLEITTFSELYIAGKDPKVGADAEFYWLLTHHSDLFSQVIRNVQDTCSIHAPREKFTVFVNRALSWKESVQRACLHGLEFDKSITEREMPILPPAEGSESSGSFEFELFRFWRNETGPAMIEELKNIGYVPADFAELLAFGIDHAEALKTHSVVGLGQTYNSFCVGLNGDSVNIVQMWTCLRPHWRILARKIYA